MFRFLMAWLLLFGLSVGSYATDEDRLGFALTDVTLFKNTWGGGKANLKILIIYENGSGERSELKVVENKKVSVNEKTTLTDNGGLYIPIHGNNVNVVVMLLNENENVFLAKLVVQAVGNISKRKSVKTINKLSKGSWITIIAKEIVVGIGVDLAIDKVMDYLKENEISKVAFTINKGRNWNQKGKKSDRNVKLSYETRFSGANSSSFSSSIQSSSTSKWINPDKSVCEKTNLLFISRGKINKYGICEADWENAKDICNDSGGRLPTIKELKEVITDCGGIVTKNSWTEIADKNKANKAYQSCYNNKGFRSFSYWSSSAFKNFGGDAWFVSFSLGFVDGYTTMGYSRFVRCVRD